MRERQGRTIPVVVKGEDEAVEIICKRVQPGSTVYADEASHWDALHAKDGGSEVPDPLLQLRDLTGQLSASVPQGGQAVAIGHGRAPFERTLDESVP